jgi:hypothetical protein
LHLVPKIIKVYYSPILSHHSSKTKVGTLRVGLKSSAILLEVCFYPFRKICCFYNNVFVDDVILASNNRFALVISVYLLEFYFRILGFKFHKKEEYAVTQKENLKVGGRLGLHFYYRKGCLFSTVRSRTLRKYLARIKSVVRFGPSEWSLKALSEILFVRNGNSYPLFWSFGAVWTSPIQKKLFMKSFCRIVRSQWFECRTMSDREIISLIRGWGYRLLFNSGNAAAETGLNWSAAFPHFAGGYYP